MRTGVPARIQTGDEARALAARLALARRRRQRIRLGAFAALGALGLALGAIWATGFATTGGQDGTTAEATPLTNNPSNNQDTSGLNGLLTSNGALSYNWDGRWGAVQDKVMYELNLTGEPGGDRYFTGVYLTNAPSGFSDLQLQLRIAIDGGDNACTTADLTATASSNYRVMVFDALDAQATFSGLGGATTGLPGAERYCIGVVNYGGSGKDSAGTFIRKGNSGPTFTGVYPTFVATVNRMP